MGAAAPAYADDGTTAPPPPPQPGKARMQVAAPVHFHGRPYIVQGSRVQVVGRVRPYVAGQTLSVRVSSPHRKSSLVRAAVKKGGAFKVLFRARRAVRYTITAAYGANAQQVAFVAR